MTDIDPILGAGLFSIAKRFVMLTRLHPILVHFTVALVPVSVGSDFLGRILKRDAFRHTGWWTLFYAALITPITAISGWLFWMPDDANSSGMAIHKWLGTAFVLVLFGLLYWRWTLHKKQAWPTIAYFIAAGAVLAALGYQGYLGGEQVFGGM